MDASAIQRLEQIIHAGSETATDLPSMIIAQGNQLVSLEKFAETPARHRAAITTQRIPDFIAYASDHIQPESALFIDPENLTAKCIMNYAGGWGDHAVTLKLSETPEYASVKKGVTFSQKALQEWLDDYGVSITPKGADGGDIALSAAYQAIAKVEIKKTNTATSEVGDFKATRTGLEDIEAKGVSSQLPAHFILNAALYEGMESRDIQLKLSVKWDDKNNPLFSLRIVGHDALKKLVIEELEGKLSAIPTKTYVGVVQINQPT